MLDCRVKVCHYNGVEIRANKPSELENLRNQNQVLEKVLQEKVKEIDDLRHNLRILESLVISSRRKIFAPSSERVVEEQMSLFKESEEITLPKGNQEEEFVLVEEHQRKKRGRKALPPDLPREEVIIDLPEDKKICPIHNEPLKEIGRDVSEKLEITPMQVKVIRTIRIKYSSPCCEKPSVIAPELPKEMIPKSISTPGLLAYIAVSKFNDGLPFYRLENIFHRYGFEITRGTMSRWMIACAERTKSLYDLMETEFLSSDYVHCDESRVQVLKEKGRKATSQSQMWVRARNGPQPIILFKYAPSRSGETAKELLKGFRGYLQVDGYGGYNVVCDGKVVIRIGCLYHVRRKFYDSLKSGSVGKKVAEKIIKIIKLIAKADEKIKKMPESTRLVAKDQNVRPLFNKLRTVIDENIRRYPSKTKIGKAFIYALNEWGHLERYFDRADLELSNNFIENAIRPFALTRKNWLFFNSVEGARAGEIIYSLIETAKANGKDPYAYLKSLFEELPNTKETDLKKLLPF